MFFGGKGVSAPAGLFFLVMAVAAMMISSSPASAKRVSFSVPVSSTVMLGNVEYEAGGALLDDAGAAGIAARSRCSLSSSQRLQLAP